LGSLALVSTIKDDVNINCDSLTIDIMKLFGIQNLPYVTCFLRPAKEIKQANENNSSHPLHEFILHSPSISFLSVWSISQRCSKDNILYHMKQSFDLSNLLFIRLKQIKALRILNHEDNQETNTYQRICSENAPNDDLPKPVVIFRFQSDDLLEVSVFGKVRLDSGYNKLINVRIYIGEIAILDLRIITLFEILREPI